MSFTFRENELQPATGRIHPELHRSVNHRHVDHHNVFKPSAADKTNIWSTSDTFAECTALPPVPYPIIAKLPMSRVLRKEVQ